jgi:hypothetical protein
MTGMEALKVVDQMRLNLPIERAVSGMLIRAVHKIRKTYNKYRLPDDPPQYTLAGKVRLRDIFLQHAKAMGTI